jgi:peptidoglycan/xylan/chitin deacetylase (PgdA/CDA1 family)
MIDRLPASAGDQALLTFDDGPHPEGTRAVLDVLHRYDARAVFFVVGSRIRRAPDMLERIVASGHVLGNHSYAHPLGRQFRFWQSWRDINQCQRAVFDLVGRWPTLFRPPLGHVSLASVTAPRVAGLVPMLWSTDSNDWKLRRECDVARAADEMLRKLESPLRHILLFHDEQRTSAQLLDRVLSRLVDRGVNLRPDLWPGWDAGWPSI